MRSIVLAIATAIALVTYAQNSALAQGVPIGVRGSVPVCTHAELHAGTCQQETAGYTATITDGLSSDPDRRAAAGTGGGGDQVTCRYKDGDWEEFEPVAGGATNLGTNVGASSVTVTSSSGADAVLPAATGSTAGVQTAADKSKLDGVSAGAIAAVVQDNAPQLGGNLDGQGTTRRGSESSAPTSCRRGNTTRSTTWTTPRPPARPMQRRSSRTWKARRRPVSTGSSSYST